MDVILTVVGSVLVVIGALVFVTAGLGLVRFPDPYTRISAVGTAGGFAAHWVRDWWQGQRPPSS